MAKKCTVSINISDPSFDSIYARTEIMVRQTQRSKQCGKTLQEELLTNDHNENIIKNWPKEELIVKKLLNSINFHARTKIMVCQTQRSKQCATILQEELIVHRKQLQADKCAFLALTPHV